MVRVTGMLNGSIVIKWIMDYYKNIGLSKRIYK